MRDRQTEKRQKDREKQRWVGYTGEKKAMHLIYVQTKYSPSSTPEIRLFVLPFFKEEDGVIIYSLVSWTSGSPGQIFNPRFHKSSQLGKFDRPILCCTQEDRAY